MSYTNLPRTPYKQLQLKIFLKQQILTFEGGCAAMWASLKSKTEAIALGFARKHYAFNFDLLFYDVTTLYFEAFEEDELRKNGFPKTTNRSNHRF